MCFKSRFFVSSGFADSLSRVRVSPQQRLNNCIIHNGKTIKSQFSRQRKNNILNGIARTQFFKFYKVLIVRVILLYIISVDTVNMLAHGSTITYIYVCRIIILCQRSCVLYCNYLNAASIIC